MDWTQVVIYTSSEGIEPVTGRLYQLDVQGVEIEDEQEFNEFLEQNKRCWDYVEEELRQKMAGETKVKTYIPQNVSGNEQVLLIKQSMEELRAYDKGGRFGRLKVELGNISEEDWADNWKQFYKPTRVADHVVVVPLWEEYDKEPGDTIVQMNPGMAFGTGTHETTRLCMQFIEKYAGKDTFMLDIGTGSGILAITGLLLGARSALGVDIDELAVKTAKENAALNGVESRFDVLCGDLVGNVQPGAYNLITANIVADVIIRLAPQVPQFLAPGGRFVASGIIDSRVEEVRQALHDAGLAVKEEKSERGWLALACTRG